MDDVLISRAGALDKIEVIMRIAAPNDYRWRIPDAIERLPAVDAVPVEWLREKMRVYASTLKSTELDAVVRVMSMWEREQEAHGT